MYDNWYTSDTVLLTLQGMFSRQWRIRFSITSENWEKMGLLPKPLHETGFSGHSYVLN